MKNLTVTLAKLFAIILIISSFADVKSQEIVLIDLELAEESTSTPGEYAIRGKLKNDGATDFSGDVEILISGNRGGLMSNGNNSSNDKVNIKHKLGKKNLPINGEESFEIIRNYLDDDVEFRNIICVWPKWKEDSTATEEKRNIICVWPKKNDNGKGGKGKNGKRMASVNPIDFNNNANVESLSYDFYPNPVVNVSYIAIESTIEQKVTITVLNNYGQNVKELNAYVSEGQTFMVVDMNDLGAGLYFFKLEGQDNQVALQTIIKQ